MQDIEIDAQVRTAFKRFRQDQGRLVVMTGAGISADSGIPTFRGADGFWTLGSRVYEPQDVATASMFRREPELVWGFYLYRIAMCLDARPNRGHVALVELEHRLNERFHLITQNVDGLHLAAGSDLARTFQIHGNLRYLRCWEGCTTEVWPLDLAQLNRNRSREQSLSTEERAMVSCRTCGGWARPHVLWFDEYYDEENFYFDSSIRAAREANLLLVVGTSGATKLPQQVAQMTAQQGGVIVEINPERTAFTDLAERSGGGLIVGGASEILPSLVERLA